MIDVWPLTSGMTSGPRHSLPRISQAHPARNGAARGRLPQRTIVPLADVASRSPLRASLRDRNPPNPDPASARQDPAATRQTRQDMASSEAIHLEVRDNRMGAWTHLPSVKNPVSALGESKARRDAEFTEYVTGRMAAWRRVGYLLCQDWDRADDLVQGAITKLYLGWNRVRAADHIDSYAHVVLVREFLGERRSGWSRLVAVDGQVPDLPGRSEDHDTALDLRSALAALPRRQRTTLVLRFYCDLNIDQTAHVLSCSPGTVKSQTAKGLRSLRQALEPAMSPAPGSEPASPTGRKATRRGAANG
jgi:RNA polymerase sigma-70 factor (sigma-E family)